MNNHTPLGAAGISMSYCMRKTERLICLKLKPYSGSHLSFCSMLRLQKRLASNVLRCGKKKVWLDPNETNEIANANSSKQVRSF